MPLTIAPYAPFWYSCATGRSRLLQIIEVIARSAARKPEFFMCAHQTTRLDSWKEIAAYLHREVRTVARWEKGKGLPVHRVPGGDRRAVFAYIEEIDAWLAGQHPDTLKPTAPWYIWFLFNRRAVIWLPVVVALMVFAILTVRPIRPGQAEQVHVRGQELSVSDGQGKLVWSYHYEEPLNEIAPGSEQRWMRIVDLDGDAQEEVLFVASSRQLSNPDAVQYELDSFSATGKMLWRHAPDRQLSFAGRRFEGPWYMTRLEVVSTKNRPEIWLSSVHSRWWPAFLERLDPLGRATLAFVNSGHIFTLAEFDVGSRQFILAGGVNNEYDSAMVAILDREKLPATSPQTPGTVHHCDDCPSGTPFLYFVFPRSELNLIEGAPYNAVWFLPAVDRQFEAITVEVRQPGTQVDASVYQSMYRFSDKFELLDAYRSDSYWDLHRRFEREGKIKHSVEQCPERIKPLSIRVWSAENGWSEVSARMQAVR